MVPARIINKEKLDIILRNIAANIAYETKFSELETDLNMHSLRILSVDKLYIYTILVHNYYEYMCKQPLKKQRVLKKMERFVLSTVITNYRKRVRLFYVPHYYTIWPD